MWGGLVFHIYKMGLLESLETVHQDCVPQILVAQYKLSTLENGYIMHD